MKRQTKQQIISQIKANLKWHDDIPSEWLNKLHVDELEKILSGIENKNIRERYCASYSLRGLMVWLYTLEGYEYWEKIYNRITK